MDNGKIWKDGKNFEKLSQKWKIENFEKMEMENFVTVILNFKFCKKMFSLLFNTHLVFEVCYMAP